MRIGEDEAKAVGRFLIPQIQSWEAETFLFNHLTTAAYSLLSKPSDEAKPNRSFHTIDSLWEGILYSQVSPNSIVELESFFLFQWLPRAPGLCFTQDGYMARQEAKNHISVDKTDGSLVYDPHGKISMLRGGIGTIRLKPREISEKTLWFMSASSSGVAHEAIPIALTEDLYNKVIDEIEAKGAINKNLVGQLRFIPESLEPLFKGYTGVRQLYLDVQRIEPPSTPKSRRMAELSVSVAVSFLSSFEGQPRLYAAYVHFNPADKASFHRNIEWMQESYVRGKYKGEIVTDFDEQQSNFTNAVFSLGKVMDFQLSKKSDQIGGFLETLGIPKQPFLVHIQHLEELHMTQFNAKKVVGPVVIGPNAHVHDIEFNINDIGDLKNLADQLQTLRSELKTRNDNDHDVEIGALASAEKAARAGNGRKVSEFLKEAGKWALDAATDIGTDLVAEVIKRSMMGP